VLPTVPKWVTVEATADLPVEEAALGCGLGEALRYLPRHAEVQVSPPAHEAELECSMLRPVKGAADETAVHPSATPPATK
jgi:hypothetical protein